MDGLAGRLIPSKAQDGNYLCPLFILLQEGKQRFLPSFFSLAPFAGRSAAVPHGHPEEITLRKGAWKPARIGLFCSSTHEKSGSSSGAKTLPLLLRQNVPVGTRDTPLLHFGKILPYRHCLLPSAAFTSPEQAGEACPSSGYTRGAAYSGGMCGAAVNAIGERRWSKTKPPKNLREKVPSLVFRHYLAQDTVPVFTWS